MGGSYMHETRLAQDMGRLQARGRKRAVYAKGTPRGKDRQRKGMPPLCNRVPVAS